MDNESLYEKIKSKYIFNTILSFINDKKVILKLFFYSKSLQNNSNITLFDYQEEFYNKRINWEDFLYSKNNINVWSFHKDELSKKLKKKLLEYKIDDNTVQKLVINYFRKNIKSKKETNRMNTDENSYYINFYSPLFDFLSKTEIFDLIFTIQLRVTTSKENNLHQYCISKFNELNKLNIRYSSLSIYFTIDEIDEYLKEYNINFAQLKKLYINFDTMSRENYNLVNTFFPLIRSAYNLVYLSMSLTGYFYENKIGPSTCEFINSFKSLEYLSLQFFKFNSNFTLNLKTLKTLELYTCINIGLTKDVCSHLKSLTLESTEIVNANNQLYSFPELEFISLERTNDKNYKSKKLYIDFQSLGKLKTFKGNFNYFLSLESPLLEEIDLKKDFVFFNDLYSIEEQKRIIGKICLSKYLKRIDLILDKINNDEKIYENQYENTSVEEMHLEYNKEECYKMYNFQNLFINLTDLFIKTEYFKESLDPKFQIIENCKSKVKNLHVNIQSYSNGYEIYCQSFEKLESIEFSLSILKEIDLKNLFPIFSDCCNVMFKCLKSCKFVLLFTEVSFEILNNIFNNLDNIPNLIEFSLNCIPKKKRCIIF